MLTPTKIKIDNRVYGVSKKHGRTKADKGCVWLMPEGEKPFQTRWPMRFHSETRVVICVK